MEPRMQKHDGPNDRNQREDRLARERLLLRYAEALLDGDLETQVQLSMEVEALADPGLEAAIWELHTVTGDEMRAEVEGAHEQALERDAELVRDLLQNHFPGRVLAYPTQAAALQDQTSAEEGLGAVTVGDVAASLRADVKRGTVPTGPGLRKEETLRILSRLAFSDEPLPERITPKGIRALLSRLGADVNRWFEQQFHEAAAHLTIGRAGNARLAAARRARSTIRKPADVGSADSTPQNGEDLPALRSEDDRPTEMTE